MKLTNHMRQQLSLLAGRSPTPHNTQPWELLITSDDLFVTEDPARRLPACDPTGRDHQIGLGAFIEGIHLVLSEEGLGVSDIVDQSSKERAEYRLKILPGFEANPLRLQISKRQCFRGVFAASTEVDRSELQEILKQEAIAVVDKRQLRFLAKEADAAATRSNQNTDIQSELYRWLRLTETHPLYRVDGLNREALALPKAVGVVAEILMRPRNYRLLDKLGLSAVLNSEAAQIRSATGLVCVQSRSFDETALERGRRLYRLWLRLTAADFYACPQSSLTDDAKAAAALKNTTGSDQTFLCLRVGRLGSQKLSSVARRNLVHITGETHEK